MLLIERLQSALGPDYEVERELAGGGMGIVFLARQRRLERPVAIKVLRPEHATAIAAERFLAEGRLLARLSHPNIVSVFDAGEADGLLYFVMELVEGETLATRLERGPLAPDEVVRLAADLLAALGAAHAQHIIHRDVKPANIFLRRGRALLGDFGIAHWRDPGDPGYTVPGQLIGTPRYMSPEQQQGAPVTTFTDVYAAGLVLYEACTGVRWPAYQTPEQGEWRGVPPSLETPMRRALALTPEDRWPDGRAFEQAITPRKRSLLRPVLVAGAVLIGIAGGYRLIRPFPTTAPVGTSTTLAVSRFELRGDGAIPGLGDSIAAAVRRDLGGYVDFYVPPDGVIADSEAVRVTGIAEAVGSHLRLTLTASDPRRPGNHLSGGSVTGNPADWRLLVDSLAPELVLELFQAETIDDPWLPRGAIPTGAQGVAAWLKAEQLLSHGDWDGAYRAYLLAVREDTTCYLCSFRLLDIARWLDTEHDSLLIQRLSGAINKFPPHYQSLINAAKAGLPGRLDTLRQAVDRYPKFALAAFEYGDELFHRGPLFGRARSEARAEIQEAVYKRPQFGPGWEHLAWVLLSEGDSTSVARALTSLEKTPVGSEFSLGLRALLGLGQAWRFNSAGYAKVFSLQVLSDPRIAANPDAVAGARLLMTTDAPAGAIELGRMLTQVDWPSKADAIREGLLGQLFGFAALGRLDSMRAVGARLDRMISDRSLALLAWELEAVLRQFDPDTTLRNDPDLIRALEGYASAGAADDPLRHRANWMLGLIAARSGDTAGAAAAQRILALKPGSSRLLRILDAAVRGGRDPAGALLALPEMPPIDVMQGPDDDPLEDAMVRLLKAEWLDRSGDRPGALNTLLWQEHLQTIGHLTGPPQPGELAWAVSTLARWNRARMLGPADGGAARCAAFASVVRRWSGSPAPFAARADSAAALARGVCQ